MISLSPTVERTNLPGLLNRSKVRDMFGINDELMLMLATDRISAFDVIMDAPIPGKGVLLSQMSAYWFRNVIGDIVPNHMVCMADDPEAFARVPSEGVLRDLPDSWRSRSMVVRRAERIDMECVVRGYLAGSAWQEYSTCGTVNDVQLLQGLLPASKLPEPIFTPSTKAEEGHDLPLSPDEAQRLVGVELHHRLEEISLRLYERASAQAADAGMILVDTKFEFGFVGGELTLIDEVLTPDSSRFWDDADWSPGKFPPAFDKQHLREWLIEIGWNREPPPPELPASVIDATRARYVTAYERLTGDLAQW